MNEIGESTILNEGRYANHIRRGEREDTCGTGWAEDTADTGLCS